MVSESKVLQSKHRNEIIDMLRSKWPLHRIRQWLLARLTKRRIESKSAVSDLFYFLRI